MVGIVSYGGYVPFYRLSRETIGKAWGKNAGKGERAVAGGDEDSITMAVEATLGCIRGIEKDEIDSLYFASARPPYAQKQSASIVSAACNLREDINTSDFGHSLRGGTSALKSAMDSVKSGSSRVALVTASECQVAPGDSPGELQMGDGAAALAIGDKDVAVSIEHVYSLTSDFLDVWRLPQDLYNQDWEDRFIYDKGYLRVLRQAVTGLIKKCNLELKDFSKVVFNAPNARYHKVMGKALGLDMKTQVQSPLYESIGDTGTASALMTLISALEQARPGDKILLANYGDGADVFVLQVNERIEGLKNGRGLGRWLDSKAMIPSYGKYLHLRDMMEWSVDRLPAPRTSLPILYRDEKWVTRLIGKRCKSCGHEQFPRTRRCMWCQGDIEKPEAFEDVLLAGQKGELFSFSMELRAAVADLPNVNCVVVLEGGARFYGLMSDRDPDKLKVGIPMEFTFRKINDAQGMHNYYWKVRPVRG